MIPVKEQIKFFDWQLSELALSWESYLQSPMQALFDGARAFTGELAGIDEMRGNVIFRFPRGRAPRLENSYALYFYKLNDGTERLKSWEIKFKDFRSSRFCHYRENSDLTPIYYLDNEDDLHRYVGCTNVDIEAFVKFKADLSAGKETKIILGEKEPPYQFLLNLKSYVASSKNHDLDLTNYTNSLCSRKLLNNSNAADTIEAEIAATDLVIVQGPPGTGKSTITAEVVAREVRKGKTVCITALSNKALTEIVDKQGIRSLRDEFRICKTALTRNELKIFPFLKSTKDVTAVGGILLTTYFKFSEAILSAGVLFDLLVIEEASQAFLPVLFSFATIAKKTLIIGDPMQLSPIVLNENFMDTMHPEMRYFVNGLDTIMRKANSNSFLLAESFRLSEFNAKLTGIFYNGLLTGRNSPPPELKLKESLRKYFASDTPHQLLLSNDFSDSEDLAEICKILKDLLNDIREKYPRLSVAILAPFKKDVLYLQQEILGGLTHSEGLLQIETVDKVQGLTVDITIVILALNGSSNFIFNKNRFNVATSRARLYNLTITDRKITFFKEGVPPEVNKFLGSLPVISI